MATIEEARHIFEEHQVLRTSQAIALGIAPKTLYRMRDTGIITAEAWGIYRLAELPSLRHPDMVTVAIRQPQAVFALITALSYYRLTDEIPNRVYIALPKGTPRPRIKVPRLEVIWLSPRVYQAGVRTVTIDTVSVKIYDEEKTICDCFKFMKKCGEDVALAALKGYIARPSSQWDIPKLLDYARINRVEKHIMPYVKALL